MRAKPEAWRAGQKLALLAGCELGKRHRAEMLKAAGEFYGGQSLNVKP